MNSPLAMNSDAAAAIDPARESLLTPAEAAQILNVTERCLENWRHRGGGPVFVRVSGRCIRYQRGDLLAWVRERLRTNTHDPGPEAVLQ